jgi:hypothetical protein
MHAATRMILVALPLALAAPVAAAQEFRPPSGGGGAPVGGVQVDVFSFSTRAGIDVSRRAKWVVGTALEVAELWSPRVRLRPSLEVASDTGSTVTFHWAAEIMYRFQPDNAPAIPYVGIGIGHMSTCHSCTAVWPTIVLGFELELRPSFNWLVEYHSLDRLGRHRFLVGLATRNASGGS